jgi:V/A-type H+-transporting ATPase subunit D
LWVRRRLATARRGTDLLDHQLRLLLGERERLALRSAQGEADWHRSAREAAALLRRGGAVAGRSGVRAGHQVPTAVVTIERREVMGVSYPADATVTFPDPSPGAPWAGDAALDAAASACREALAAAAHHAVTEAALRRLDAEIAAIRRRVRALKDRYVPRLEEQEAAVSAALEEAERADAVRLRWAIARRADSGAGPARTGGGARS